MEALIESEGFVLEDSSRIPEAATWLINKLENKRIWLFYGDMGAGKTTLISEICKQLGVDEEISSPTFSIVNEYRGEKGKIYHFDFYRLNETREAVEIGAEDYFFSDARCFIEWPQLIEELLPGDEAIVSIRTLEDRTREIVLG